MKSILTALLFIGSYAMAMTTLPEGSYQGQGRWADGKGQTGGYELEVTVRSDVVSSAYDFDGQAKTFAFEAKLDANGQFDVLVGGQKMGSGYCKSVQCHYSISFGETDMEETLTFYQDHLYRLGSKRENGKAITWEESMSKKGN